MNNVRIDEQNKAFVTLRYCQPISFALILCGLYLCHALSLIEGLAERTCLLLQILLTIALLLLLWKGITKTVEVPVEEFRRYLKKQKRVWKISLLGLPLFYIASRIDGIFACIVLMIAYVVMYVFLLKLFIILNTDHDMLMGRKLLDRPASQQKPKLSYAEEVALAKRRKMQEHRALINSAQYLDDVFGTERIVFNIKFGCVIVSSEKKMIRLYERDFHFSQIVDYETKKELERGPCTTEVVSVPVQVVSSTPNTASVIGRAYVGSKIAGTWGAVAGAASASREYTVSTEYRTGIRPTCTILNKYYINVKVKESDREIECLNIGNDTNAFYEIKGILDDIIKLNKTE